MVDCAAQQLLEGHSAIDEVIRFKKGFLGRPMEAWKCVQELRARRFDLAIDPQGLLKSAFLTWTSGARTRIGFDRHQAREKAWWFYTHAIRPRPVHLIRKQLQLLEPIGIVSPTPHFGFETRSTDEPFVEQLLVEHGLTRRKFALLNVGAGWPSRRWPTERFVDLSIELWKNRNLRSLVVWAGESERETAQTICQETNGACVLAPPTTLMQLAAIIKSSQIMVTSDTGPMHIASALNIPTIALFGPTRPEHSGPVADLSVAIQKGNEIESIEDKKSKDNRLLRRIEVQDVVDACERILSQTHNS